MARDFDRMQKTLAKFGVKFGALALLVALLTGFARPAAAEFFGCNDQHASRAVSQSRSSYAQAHDTRDYAAQSRHPPLFISAGRRQAVLERPRAVVI